MGLEIKELKEEFENHDFRTIKEIEEFCIPIYDEIKKIRLDFQKDTLLDKKLLEHFKNDNPKDRFSSIMVAGTILAGIQLRNLWRENGKLDGKKEKIPYNEKQIEMIQRYNDLQDIVEDIEWYVERTVLEDEEELK